MDVANKRFLVTPTTKKKVVVNGSYNSVILLYPFYLMKLGYQGEECHCQRWQSRHQDTLANCIYYRHVETYPRLLQLLFLRVLST